ncbi:MAG: FliH/SctL family protein [Myxococcota bacterium]
MPPLRPGIHLHRAEVEAIDRARSIVQEAEARADAHVAAAAAEAQHIRRRAEEAGYERGKKAGLAGWVRAVEEVERRRAAMEDQLLDVIRQAATEVFVRELDQCPDGMRDVIRAALDASLQSDDVRFHLHPEDLLQVQARHSWPRAISLNPDPLVLRGTCRVVMASGVVESGLDVHLTNLQARFQADPQQDDGE